MGAAPKPPRSEDLAYALLCIDLALACDGERREYWTHRANWFLKSALEEATSPRHVR